MARIIARNRVVICLLFLMSILPNASFLPASAQISQSTPVLSVAAAVALPSTLIKVEGEGFTPDGLVYIAIYDRWGEDDYGHVWAIAAHGHYGVSGSDDPDLGYVPAGAIDVVIDLSPAMVYGPNGFQVPTVGIGLGDGQVIAEGACGRDLMVRAHDVEAAAWSNLLDVTASC
jgi:hypothetical protein